ncbi:hypothetical protein [Haloferula sp. BvORR071]|uniref:hypothetical protein n=1 Tax=Haloferula sp. BvORR071 TaxID=1396141 RepID=UPI002240F7F5|nr:hypothetical protein [Haloferula sp. BvORR071]
MPPVPFRPVAESALSLLLMAGPASAAEFTSPALPAVSSWIGNSYGGAQKWVQQDIAAITVTPDGTVFTNVEWEEGGGNVGEYRDGELIGYAGHTHGWGNGGGKAVAANSKYLFIAMCVSNEGGGLVDPGTWPPKGKKWYGISRRPRSDIRSAAPFPGGKGGKGDTLNESFLVIAEVADDDSNPITGICADESRVYVVAPQERRIKVFDCETMQQLNSWEVERTGPLTLGPTGKVWMMSGRTKDLYAGLEAFTPEGKTAGGPQLISTIPDARAFCFDAEGRPLVVEDGPGEQIHPFHIDPRTLVAQRKIGAEGGILAPVPGIFADKKFNHITAIGCDAKDRLYVAQDGQSGGGGTVLECYDLKSQALLWRLVGLTFVDMADFDPGDETGVYTKEEHFRFDPSKPPGKEASYHAFTLNRVKYPEDPRLHIWSGGAWLRRIGGQRVLFVNDMNGEHLQVYRFAPESDGEIAIPSGLFAKKHVKVKTEWPPHQPEKGEWIWRDADGNGAFDEGEFTANGGDDAPSAQGWWVDAAGNVWLATEKDGIRLFPSQGLDPKENPRWDFATIQSFPHPAEFQEVKRLRYDPATDTMYLGGSTAEDKNQHWKPMGPVLARYDHWLKGERKCAWTVTLPYVKGSSGHESCEPMGFDVAGDFIFVPYTGASKSAGVCTGRVEIFRTRDGSAVGHVEPGPEIGEVGLQDLRETVSARLGKDGEYRVMIEDDYKSKVVLYRIKGLK